MATSRVSIFGTGLVKDDQAVVMTAVQSVGAAAVNYAEIGNSATGNAVTVTAKGTDANIGVNIVPKGTGVLQNNGKAMNTLKVLYATTTWDPPNIVDGAISSKDVTVTGALVGDIVSVGFSSVATAGWIICGNVRTADTVSVELMNKTGAAVDLALGTLKVQVRQ